MHCDARCNLRANRIVKSGLRLPASAGAMSFAMRAVLTQKEATRVLSYRNFLAFAMAKGTQRRARGRDRLSAAHADRYALSCFTGEIAGARAG